MSDDAADTGDESSGKSKLPIIIGTVLALLGAGGGFYATYSGMLGGVIPGEEKSAEAPEAKSVIPEATTDVAFIEIDPMVVSVGALDSGTHLRFRAQLEVPDKYEAEVSKVMPRIVGVLNGYLRAVELSDIQETGALLRLRSQMLRRVKVVAGEDRVRDLLVMEFVVS
ncbi:flagellar basal body-associated FliL family protein [Poseidonocella sedimentorum]|uniref:Flagellar protein FliL n=1 Tax=Poseidonocella sedimentorum TaxID=871652 RepID=A0A1I6D5R9_9RHOB|nr:flagellar basal body-associated FliL family protein [Poseidonocella sedimentorum]SFR00743.1 flagellar FliL protein [Poseidonocella sedimentorum]